MNKKLNIFLIFIVLLVGISCVSAENMMEKNKNEIEKILTYPYNFIHNIKYNLH